MRIIIIININNKTNTSSPRPLRVIVTAWTISWTVPQKRRGRETGSCRTHRSSVGGEGVENKIERRLAQTLVRVVEREEHVEHGVAFIASEKRVVSTSDSDYESEENDESN